MTFDPTAATRLAAELESIAANTPYPYAGTKHIAEAASQLRAAAGVEQEMREIHATLKAVVDYALDNVGMPITAMLGPDAPLKVMRKLHEERDRRTSDLAAAREEGERYRAEFGHALRDRADAHRRADINQRVVDVARRVVSRGIHRRNAHRELFLREVALLPNDIEILTRLAEALDKAGVE